MVPPVRTHIGPGQNELPEPVGSQLAYLFENGLFPVGTCIAPYSRDDTVGASGWWNLYVPGHLFRKSVSLF